MKPVLPADPFPPGRARDARRAALYGGVYVGAVLAVIVAGNGAGAAAVAFAFVLWGALGAAGGALAVYTGAGWRTAAGRWHVAPLFVALAIGTPAVMLAGMMVGGELYGRSGLAAAAAWVAGVSTMSIVRRLRRNPA
jgi:hypothetical protein